jgi:hypothetical protein
MKLKLNVSVIATVMAVVVTVVCVSVTTSVFVQGVSLDTMLSQHTSRARMTDRLTATLGNSLTQHMECPSQAKCCGNEQTSAVHHCPHKGGTCCGTTGFCCKAGYVCSIPAKGSPVCQHPAIPSSGFVKPLLIGHNQDKKLKGPNPVQGMAHVTLADGHIVSIPVSAELVAKAVEKQETQSQTKSGPGTAAAAAAAAAATAAASTAAASGKDTVNESGAKDGLPEGVTRTVTKVGNIQVETITNHGIVKPAEEEKPESPPMDASGKADDDEEEEEEEPQEKGPKMHINMEAHVNVHTKPQTEAQEAAEAAAADAADEQNGPGTPPATGDAVATEAPTPVE